MSENAKGKNLAGNEVNVHGKLTCVLTSSGLPHTRRDLNQLPSELRQAGYH